MIIDEVIANLDNTIKGKLALKATLDPVIGQIIDVNIAELERIRADLEKVRDGQAAAAREAKGFGVGEW